MLARELCELLVELTELLYLLFEHGCGELGKDGIGADVRFDEVAVYVLSETAEYVIG